MEIKSKIIENSLELFLSRGCKSVTMDDIAKANGISKRTLYENFPDKAALLEESIGYLHCHMRMYAQRLEDESTNILDFLFKIYETQSDIMINLKINFFKELKIYYSDIYKRTVESLMVYPRERTVKYIEKGKNEGIIIEDVDSTLVSRVVIEITHMLEDDSAFELKHYSRKDLFREIVIRYFRGLATQRGIEIIDEYIAKSN